MMKKVDFWRKEFANIAQQILVLRCLLLPAAQLDKLKKIKTLKYDSMNSKVSPILLPIVKFIRDFLKLTQFDEAEIAQVGFLVRYGGVCVTIEGLRDAFVLEPRDVCD